MKTEYELKNGGREDVSSFVHIMLADEAARLSWMSAFETGKEASKFRISRVLHVKIFNKKKPKNFRPKSRAPPPKRMKKARS